MGLRYSKKEGLHSIELDDAVVELSERDGVFDLENIDTGSLAPEEVEELMNAAVEHATKLGAKTLECVILTEEEQGLFSGRNATFIEDDEILTGVIRL